jgi:N4-gp56 family major capsid protein
MTVLAYGDISPRTAAYAIAELLKRAMPYLVLEKFGQAYPIPSNMSKVAKFRRYEALPLATTPLTEGVTPVGKTLTSTDVTATLQQYGDFVTISDVIADTHEDPVFQQAQQILAEQAAQTIETIRFSVLKAGTNVFYANSVAGRANVATALSLTDQRRITRTLKRQNARHISSIIRSTPSYNTENVEASFIGLCHSDCENDIRNMTGYINPKDYGTITPWENEIGAVDDVRYLRSTIFTPWLASGVVVGSAPTMISDGGVNVDVYPVLYVAADAYGIVPLKGLKSITPTVLNPKPTPSDPLGQRGYVSWKVMQTAVILNDAWMVRGEFCATE